MIGVFLDFSKAFDTVNHDVLLQKLHHNSIRGSALNWFQSYLSDRQQYVTYNGKSLPRTELILVFHKVPLLGLSCSLFI